MALSPNDDSKLSEIGVALLNNLVVLCPQLVLYGIYLVFFPYSVHILWRRPSKAPSTYILLIAICVLFLSATLDLGAWIAFQVVELRRFLISPRVALQSRQLYVVDRLAPVSRTIVLEQALRVAIADAIVMWRAWVLYTTSVLVRFTMAIVVLSNALLIMTVAILAALNGSTINLSTDTALALNSTITFVSFGTNLLATLFIAYRAWMHRRDMTLLGSYRKSKVANVLILLAETGVILCIMQLANAIITIYDTDARSHVHQATQVIASVTNMSAVILSTFIIIVVGRENNTFNDSTMVLEITRPKSSRDNSAASSSQPVSTLQFASIDATVPVSPGTSTRDGEIVEIERKVKDEFVRDRVGDV